MLKPQAEHPAPLKPGRIGLIALYLIFSGVFVRTLAEEEIRPFLSLYLGLELVYLLLFTLVIWKYDLMPGLMHLYLGIQSALVLWMLSLRPEFDFVVDLFALLAYQVSLAFTGRVRWIWIAVLVALTGGSLTIFLGLKGFALSLTTIAAEIVIPAYVRVNHEIETARTHSQVLLADLQETHRQLQSYAGQVEELAAMQERGRLARELHDTVSQEMFSIALTNRSAQLLLDKDPARASEQLQRLLEMATKALAQLRSLITQLRPAHKP